MRLPTRLIGTLPITTAILLGAAGLAAGCAGGRASQLGPMVRDDLPDLARKTIERETAGGTITRLERGKLGGEVRYVVDWQAGNKRNSMEVLEDGRLARADIEITRAELPRPVRTTVDAQTTGRVPRISRMFLVTDRFGLVEYRVEDLTTDERRISRYSREGVLVDQTATSTRAGTKPEETAIAQNDVPEAAWTVIASRVGNAKVDELSRLGQGDKTLYVAEWTKDGRMREVEVLADGRVSSEEVEIDRGEVPEAVIGSVNAAERTREAKTFRYFRVQSSEAGLAYEIEVTAPGRETTYTISPDGRVIERQEERKPETDSGTGS